MTLEQAWKLLEFLNENANDESKILWMSSNIDRAANYQAECFRKSFSGLDKMQRLQIQKWIEQDAELRDYFECLSDNMIIDIICKD